MTVDNGPVPLVDDPQPDGAAARSRAAGTRRQPGQGGGRGMAGRTTTVPPGADPGGTEPATETEPSTVDPADVGGVAGAAGPGRETDPGSDVVDAFSAVMLDAEIEARMDAIIAAAPPLPDVARARLAWLLRAHPAP